MIKSREEIQKTYRRRLKEEYNEGYLAKNEPGGREHIFQMTCFQVEQRSRNKKNREYMKLYRQRKKVAAQTVINPVENQDESFNTEWL